MKLGISTSHKLYGGEGSTLSQTKHLEHVCWGDGGPGIVKKQTTMKPLHSVFVPHVVLVPHRPTPGPVRALQLSSYTSFDSSMSACHYL